MEYRGIGIGNIWNKQEKRYPYIACMNYKVVYVGLVRGNYVFVDYTNPLKLVVKAIGLSDINKYMNTYSNFIVNDKDVGKVDIDTNTLSNYLKSNVSLNVVDVISDIVVSNKESLIYLDYIKFDFNRSIIDIALKKGYIEKFRFEYKANYMFTKIMLIELRDNAGEVDIEGENVSELYFRSREGVYIDNLHVNCYVDSVVLDKVDVVDMMSKSDVVTIRNVFSNDIDLSKYNNIKCNKLKLDVSNMKVDLIYNSSYIDDTRNMVIIYGDYGIRNIDLKLDNGYSILINRDGDRCNLDSISLKGKGNLVIDFNYAEVINLSEFKGNLVTCYKNAVVNNLIINMDCNICDNSDIDIEYICDDDVYFNINFDVVNLFIESIRNDNIQECLNASSNIYVNNRSGIRLDNVIYYGDYKDVINAKVDNKFYNKLCLIGKGDIVHPASIKYADKVYELIKLINNGDNIEYTCLLDGNKGSNFIIPLINFLVKYIPRGDGNFTGDNILDRKYIVGNTEYRIKIFEAKFLIYTIYVYVNGELKFVSKPLNSFNFRFGDDKSYKELLNILPVGFKMNILKGESLSVLNGMVLKYETITDIIGILSNLPCFYAEGKYYIVDVYNEVLLDISTDYGYKVIQEKIYLDSDKGRELMNKVLL